MSMVVEGVAKHEAKAKLKAKIKKTASDTASKGKESAKAGGKKILKRAKDSKINPKFMPAPTSYSVRKQHNILIGMWFASSAVYAFAYYNSDGAISTATFWKRFMVIQFAFFCLSLAVLSDAFARAVGSLSVLVFMGICLTNQNFIINGVKGISAGGLFPPTKVSSVGTKQDSTPPSVTGGLLPGAKQSDANAHGSLIAPWDVVAIVPTHDFTPPGQAYDPSKKHLQIPQQNRQG